MENNTLLQPIIDLMWEEEEEVSANSGLIYLNLNCRPPLAL